MSSVSTVTLSSVFYTFNGVDGYIHPGDSPIDWWTLGDDTDGYINIDPGKTIRVKTVETRELGDYRTVIHKNLADVGCMVHECRDFDLSYYNFTITNSGQQGVRLDFGDSIAYIIT